MTTTTDHHRIRREPFTVLFPLALLLGLAGVVPWLLIGLSLGGLSAWPGAYHAFAMSQGFLIALAVGFLGTMLPRRTAARPLSLWEIAVICAALVLSTVCAFIDRPGAAQAGFVVVLLTLLQYILTALRKGNRSGRRPPPAHMWLPIGLVLGLLGAGLLCLAAVVHLPDFLVLAGRRLAQQGMMLCLVLGLAPMLSSILRTGAPPPHEEGSAASRRAQGLLIVLFVGSFFLEPFAERAALLLRGLLCLIAVVRTTQPFSASARGGLHRRLFRLALLLVPAGLLLSGLDPLHRVAFLHVTLVGGLGLLGFAVSLHVSLLHSGHEALAETSPLAVWLGGLLILLAMAARTSADLLGRHYVQGLGVAALCFLLGGVVWVAFLLRLILSARPAAPHAAPSA